MTLSLILKCTVALNAEYFQLLRAAVYVGKYTAVLSEENGYCLPEG